MEDMWEDTGATLLAQAEEEVKDSWEDEDEDENEEVPVPEPMPQTSVPKPQTENKSKTKPKTGRPGASVAEVKITHNATLNERTLTPQEIEQLQRKSDLQQFKETFGITDDQKAAFTELEPTKKEDFKDFANFVIAEIRKHYKKPGYSDFLCELVRALCLDVDSEHVRRISKDLSVLATEMQKREKEIEKISNITDCSNVGIRFGNVGFNTYDDALLPYLPHKIQFYQPMRYKSLNQTYELKDFENDENALLLKDSKRNDKQPLKHGSPPAQSQSGLRSRGNWRTPSNDSPRINLSDVHLNQHRSSSAEPKTRVGTVLNDPNIIYIEWKVQKNDSLRNLALQYGTTVAELKRAKCLLADQEFYGRDIIKIPVKRYCTLALTNEQQSSPTLVNLDSDFNVKRPVVNHNQLPSTSGLADCATANTGPQESQSIADRSSASLDVTPSTKIAAALESPNVFLRAVDESLHKAKENVARQNGHDRSPLGPAENTTLQDVDVYEAAALRRNVRHSWWQRNVTHFVVVVLLIFLVLLIPLFIVLYNVVMAVEGEGS